MFRLERQTHYHRSSSELLPILSYANANDGQTSRTSADTSMSRWPWVYWLLLKILCLFHTRKVVCSRRCHQCRLDKIHWQRQQAGNTGPLPNYLYPSAIDTPAGWLYGDNEDEVSMILGDENANETPEDQRDEECCVCQSMWWDADGKCRVYTEKDVGMLKLSQVDETRFLYRMFFSIRDLVPLKIISIAKTS